MSRATALDDNDGLLSKLSKFAKPRKQRHMDEYLELAKDSLQIAIELEKVSKALYKKGDTATSKKIDTIIKKMIDNDQELDSVVVGAIRDIE